MTATHIIGAGLAGLSAALALTGGGCSVTLYESGPQAGGRCRSYFDRELGCRIDNGNHLLLSGNKAALSYLRTLGSQAGMIGPAHADFAFIDLSTRNRWTVRISDGRVPFWIFDRTRRVPDTKFADYLALAPLIWAGKAKTVGDAMTCSGALYERLAQPVLLAALNLDPPQGSAALAGAIIRETLLAGGQA